MARKRRTEAEYERKLFFEAFQEYKILNAKEERALLMRKNEIDARNQLICHNYRLIFSIAKKYQYLSDYSVYDLFQFGVVGLIEAIENYDPTYDTRLSTLAYRTIQCEVIRRINQNSAVGISENLMKAINEMVLCQRELTSLLEREPMPRELAEKLKISLEELERRRKLHDIIKPISLSQTVYDDEKKTLSDILEDSTDLDEVLDKDLRYEKLYAALSSLASREQEILRLYYGFDMQKALSQPEIARQMGISKQRVQQIVAKAIETLSLRLRT